MDAVEAVPPAKPSQLRETLDKVKTKLPPSIATSVTVLELHASSLSKQLEQLSTTGQQQIEALRQNHLKPDQFLQQAFSVKNDTQLALNISLNQVGPIFYAVILPNEIFERRLPPLYFVLQVRVYPATAAYTPFSVSWPILALAGPVVVATSLLAIPFVAVAVGGSALASLVGFGTAVSSGASAVGSGVVAAGVNGGKTIASLSAKASIIPGGAKLRGKLVDAAKEQRDKVQEIGTEIVRTRVVRYFSKGVAAGAIGGVAAGAGAEAKEEEPKEKRKALEEIEVTGMDMIKVLKCETGSKRVDKKLIEAFSKLSFKTSKYQPSTNPVLRITGGPELETRGKKEFLVFYPFVVKEIKDVVVEAIPTTELPATEIEQKLLDDVQVVDSIAEAEKVVEAAPTYATGAEWSEQKQQEKSEASISKVEKKKTGWFW